MSTCSPRPLKRALRFLFPIMLAANLLLAHASRGEITIARQPAAVERKTFDPAHPPADLPHLNPGEAAMTESVFNCSVSTSYHATDHQSQPGSCKTTVKVDDVVVKLQLHVTIWLPAGAPKKLIAHEEGHRQIAETVYQTRAESAARAAAQKLDGRLFTGTGRDCDEAATAALNDADNRLCQDYLDQTGAPADRLGVIYDQITAHGTKYWPPEDEAIRQAFERDQKEQAAHAGGATTRAAQ